MARSATTLDPFSAVAEPKRRQVLEALAAHEQPVNDLVATLGWPQPMVSKHLGVLREVGLVNVRDEGRQRIYSVNGDRMRPIYEWARTFERFWTAHLDAIQRRAEQKALEQKSKPSPKSPSQEK